MKLSEYKLLKQYIKNLGECYPFNYTCTAKHFFEKQIIKSFDFQCFVLLHYSNQLKMALLKVIKSWFRIK